MNWETWWEVKQVDFVIEAVLVVVCIALLIIWAVFEKK